MSSDTEKKLQPIHAPRDAEFEPEPEQPAQLDLRSHAPSVNGQSNRLGSYLKRNAQTRKYSALIIDENQHASLVTRTRNCLICDRKATGKPAGRYFSSIALVATESMFVALHITPPLIV